MNSELGKKVDMAINRLQGFEPLNGEGYFLAFSGGKDSVVIKRLADMAGVKYDAHFHLTSVDPPELIKFIKEHYADVIVGRNHYKNDFDAKGNPKPITMWNLIPKKSLPPTRIQRYCCAQLKESAGDGRKTVTGVRWAESSNRRANQGIVTLYGKKAKKEVAESADFQPTKRGGFVLINDNEDSRMMVEQCYVRQKTVVNPIIDWTDNDVWEFIRTENIPYCGLYDDGMKRIGCIGCPMASTRERSQQFQRWEKYKINYIHTFEKLIKANEEKGTPFHLYGGTVKNPTGEDIFHWWMEDGIMPGQIQMDLNMDDSEEEL